MFKKITYLKKNRKKILNKFQIGNQLKIISIFSSKPLYFLLYKDTMIHIFLEYFVYFLGI